MIRKLTEDDVEFKIDMEWEECSTIEGNALASGDDERDKAYEQELIDRCNRGDMTAWFCVTVKATWKVGEREYSEWETLGCCSLSDEFECASSAEVQAELDELIETNGIKASVLDRLNEMVATMDKDLGTLRS